METRKEGTPGFTLVELLVVIVIVAILSSAVALNVIGQVKPAYKARISADFRAIQDSIKMFKLNTGNYPETLEELMMDPGARGWNGPYLERPPMDPWGRPYVYEQVSSGPLPFEVKTFGADGTPGGDEDNSDYSSFDIFEEYASK
jgi:general secretion pathway protein G